jgi:hypothetical protein
VLHEPAGVPRAAAVVCHPHPQYGGDMDNPIVVAVADALAGAGIAALRFDFGAYDGGREEQCDVGAAEAALATRVAVGTPCAIVGYSFGAWVGACAAVGLPRVRRVAAIGPPLAFFADWSFADALREPLGVVVGDRDQYCPTDALDRLVASHRVRTTILAGADHFFAGFEARVARAVVDLVADLR